MTHDANAVLEFRDVQLRPHSRPFSFSLRPGDMLAVMGPAGSGKSTLVRSLLQQEAHADGVIDLRGKLLAPLSLAGKPRRTPSEIARALFDRKAKFSEISKEFLEILRAIGLEEIRQEPVISLSESHQVGCQLLPFLRTDAEVFVIDGLLDRLDPWARQNVLKSLVTQCQRGNSVNGIQPALLVTTQLPEIAEQLGELLLLDNASAIAYGPVDGFRKFYRPDQVIVEADDGSTIRSMAEPFALQISQSGSSLQITTEDGQVLAARLLAQGYGTIRTAYVREASLQEALEQAISRKVVNEPDPAPT